MDKPLDCGRCDKDTCPDCQEIKSRIEFLQKHICSNNCKCLCVLERPNNALGDIDIFSTDFKTGCGNRINAMLINEIRAMKEELVKERIQYKAQKQKQDALITKQGILIESMRKALLMRGISI